ncbi:Pc22g05030 [Penicillium rubens Wisconsin 54-1255]|uniref:tyrosinase n=1 Tax=Penicillium rubens (strain ATCC 28089 / DSM 1075 / NRRL 1951 / Wisconsin 54-1255) TaxID=500485 RepID=B6HTY5_PENRW|nr:Pc22g05030 [Penicillium rubens Wisconsin 54-1255]
MASTKFNIPLYPTWDDHVTYLFSRPFWIVDSDPEAVGRHWISQMHDYSPSAPKHLHLDLSSLESVKSNVEVIPEAKDPKMQLRIRKDILLLSEEEIQAYREKLDDILKVRSLNSPWQELGLLHAEWCLHYQEAFVFWHRAYLKYVEELIDFPIPYWNGFAAESSDPSSSNAGIPSIFLDEFYVHSSGETRKNPLKYAFSLNGTNKSGTSPYVERYQELVDGRSNPKWSEKVGMFALYHRQIANALSQKEFSLQQGHGYPWGNIPDFSENQPDSLYPTSARQYFDGLFEQVHDNYHGWIGPDMADNSYTAFDPIFLSYHANMDRIAEIYLRTGHGRRFSSNFPLRPFVDNASALAYDESREYRYTTLGDMAKPTRAMRYLYDPPKSPDFFFISEDLRSAAVSTGGMAVSMSAEKQTNGLKPETELRVYRPGHTPYVVFCGISCLQETYVIDVFVSQACDLEPVPKNGDYVGRVTRLGMGKGRGEKSGIRNPQRCQKTPITRILDATDFAEDLHQKGIIQIVTELHTGRRVDESEWRKMPGFEGKIIWLSKGVN